MFDMSWGEIMVIGGVALIVIGPKDLPKALRTVGRMTTKVRRMAGEFQSQFSEAMREAELEDVRKEVEGLNRDVSAATSSAFNPLQTIRDELKGSIESRPPVPTAGGWTPGQSEIGLAPLAGDGSVNPAPDTQLNASQEGSTIAPPPETPSPSDIVAEIQPLVPLAIDEPVPLQPASHGPPAEAHDPARFATGPGLEHATEAEPLKSARS